MNWLSDLPIRKTLTRVILLTCTLVLLLACGVLAAYELFDFRRTMARDMTVLADVLAKNTRAAMAFDDELSATETLSALQAEPDVIGAALFTAEGRRFASYAAPGFPPDSQTQVGSDGHRFESGRLVLFRPITLNAERIGTIYLEAGMEGIYRRLSLFGGIAGLVLLGSLAVAFAISSRLQRPISEPILSLASSARAIAESKGHVVRAAPEGINEIGLLTDAFDQMVRGIEEREAALRESNDSLTGEVSERKRAEDRVQSQLSRLELLNQITRAIGERQDLPSIFQVVIGSVEDRMPAGFTCVCHYDAKDNAFTVASLGPLSEKPAASMDLGISARIRADANGLARCAAGQLVYEPDLAHLDLPFPKRLARGGLRSVVLAPLVVEKNVFGVLVVGRTAPDSFSSGECEFLRQLSEHAALAAHQAQLYGDLEQAYNDLRQTQAAVLQQERLRALGQMASGIAHDINNAMSPAALYTESLLENEPNLSPRARSYLQTIQHAIEDVAQTVARMREFYRRREPQLELMPVNLNRLVQQVIDLSRARWSDMPQERGVVIRLVTDLEPKLQAVLGIESELREALINLVFNAVDAMPDGGTMTLRTRRVGNALDAPGLARVAVEVADTGVGMNEETRRRCLEPFFTTKGERGTGLGLAMVYGVVQRHGAELSFESVVGEGTRVAISFALPATSSVEPLLGEGAFVAPEKLKILIIDDDPLLVVSLRDILETDGHRVVTANGGQAGIDAFMASLGRADPFSVVLTDLGMPHVDGRKVSEAVKAASPQTPVILVTGWGQRLVADGEVPPHVDRVLNKPARLHELRAALAALTRRTRPA
jgi:signal transduction histidine kinase/CheY-like chemotaxis protein/HAMP domain-containing protein